MRKVQFTLGEVTEPLTSHMKACVAFFNVNPAAWTVLKIRPQPALGLLIIWIAVLSSTVVLSASHALVPAYLVSETHFECTLPANDERVHVICLFVELAVLTAFTETPAEAGIR